MSKNSGGAGSERASAPSAAIFGCAGTAITADERAFFRDADPWGFILFARNIGDGDAVRALVASLRDAVGRRAPVLIDQEGGRVARLTPPLARRFTPVGAWCALVDEVGVWTEAELAEALRLRHRLIAADLAAFDIDVNCAPLADLRLPDADPIIGDRALGGDGARVGQRARVAVDALLAGGVLPVVKHMPGHGRARVDTHVALPEIGADDAALAQDFAAFEAVADAPLGMTAHVIYSMVDEDRPATWSPTVITSVIRERIGFGGALISDDLSMGALSGPIGERARAALEAGCDLALHCNGDLAEMRAVAALTPRLAGDAQTRTDQALAARRPAAPFSPAEAAARLQALGAPGADALEGEVADE